MRRLLLLFVVLVSLAHAAETVSVAAAANLVNVLDDLNIAYRKTNPDVTVTSAVSSSGNLVAQIKNGAPYDVFLSADLDFPRALIKSGQADAASFFTFATGRLVLWTTRPELKLDSVADVVRDPSVRKIAVANLDTAPYGRAAKETLAALKLWDDAKPKLVIGENISQTAQFVQTRNAEIGFVAMSLVLDGKMKKAGHWVAIPEELHAPLEQGAVLTLRGAANPAAKRYLEFLRSPEARAIFVRFGYATPAS